VKVVSHLQQRLGWHRLLVSSLIAGLISFGINPSTGAAPPDLGVGLKRSGTASSEPRTSPKSATTSNPSPSPSVVPADAPLPLIQAPPKPSKPAPVGVEDPAAAERLFGKKINQFEIHGLKRIERDAVLAKVTTKPGGILTSEHVRTDIQTLFNMGYFDDITFQGEAVGTDLVNVSLVVRERPVIANVQFDGNERISSSDLKDVIKVKQWSILDINKVKDDVALIQKHYEDKGFYLAKVTYDIRTVRDDEVEVTYRINDYEKVQIKKITFLNNKKFKDEQLKSVFRETKEGGFFSFMSGSGNFKESAFKQDLQMLTYWYLEHGYVKFKYGNPVITVSDDKKWLYISIYVEEGEQYQMGNIDFAGDLLFPKEELNEELTLKTDDTFSISKRNQDIQRLTEKYQDLGYAFVNVVPKMEFHDDSRTLDVQYDFEKGNLAYFGEINIIGNTKTYDKVIRRELKIHEGELYSGTSMRQSRENVERLGFFAPGEVIFNTVSPKGRPDILDVEITVKERSTGTITLGAGYGSYQGFFFTSQISEINLLGRGQALSLAAQYSIRQLSQSLNLGFTEPSTFDTRWTTGFDIYALKFPIPNRWITSKLGFDIRFGHPIVEFTNAYITFKHEGIQNLDPDESVSQDVIRADSGILASVTLSVIRDKRNNRFETTGGNYQSASIETAGLYGDKKFIKWVVNNRYYKRLVGDLVFRNSVELGQIAGYGGEVTPPSQRFYLGGPNNMKGYQLFLLGPQTVSSKGFPQPLGGHYEAYSLFELEYPLIREAGIKGVVFFDVGNTWDESPFKIDPFVIRADTGFGFRWFSPIGPLRFEWGFPIAARPEEQSPVFQFFIGPPF
jgi:outer membrane protein insertion porin family